MEVWTAYEPGGSTIAVYTTRDLAVSALRDNGLVTEVGGELIISDGYGIGGPFKVHGPPLIPGSPPQHWR